MIELLDSAELRLVVYGVAAMSALVLWRRERDEVATCPERSRWPRFWLLSAALLAAMGVARAIDLGDVVADLGRDEADAQGWYDTRIVVQAAIVGAMASAWAVIVTAGIWRAIVRRGRYLPTATLLVSLLGFAAVRVVSLHHIDALLYRRDILGLRIVSLVELSLLGATIASMRWFPYEVRNAETDANRPA